MTNWNVGFSKATVGSQGTVPTRVGSGEDRAAAEFENALNQRGLRQHGTKGNVAWPTRTGLGGNRGTAKFDNAWSQTSLPQQVVKTAGLPDQAGETHAEARGGSDVLPENKSGGRLLGCFPSAECMARAEASSPDDDGPKQYGKDFAFTIESSVATDDSTIDNGPLSAGSEQRSRNQKPGETKTAPAAGRQLNAENSVPAGGKRQASRHAPDQETTWRRILDETSVEAPAANPVDAHFHRSIQLHNSTGDGTPAAIEAVHGACTGGAQFPFQLDAEGNDDALVLRRDDGSVDSTVLPMLVPIALPPAEIPLPASGGMPRVTLEQFSMWFEQHVKVNSPITQGVWRFSLEEGGLPVAQIALVRSSEASGQWTVAMFVPNGDQGAAAFHLHLLRSRLEKLGRGVADVVLLDEEAT